MKPNTSVNERIMVHTFLRCDFSTFKDSYDCAQLGHAVQLVTTITLQFCSLHMKTVPDSFHVQNSL